MQICVSLSNFHKDIKIDSWLTLILLIILHLSPKIYSHQNVTVENKQHIQFENWTKNNKKFTDALFLDISYTKTRVYLRLSLLTSITHKLRILKFERMYVFIFFFLLFRIFENIESLI